MTALEYQQGEWSIFDYQKAVFEDEPSEESQTETEELEGQLDVKQLLDRFKRDISI